MISKKHRCSEATLLRLVRWATSLDTGTSSMFVAGVIAFGPEHRAPLHGNALPSAFDDFGRCLHLLQNLTEDQLAQALATLRKVSREWSAFIDRWSDLTALAASRAVSTESKYRSYDEIVADARLAAREVSLPVPLARGEVLQPGDEFLSQPSGWIPTTRIGLTVDRPNKYRRPHRV